jgi:hypothetical protein
MEITVPYQLRFASTRESAEAYLLTDLLLRSRPPNERGTASVRYSWYFMYMVPELVDRGLLEAVVFGRTGPGGKTGRPEVVRLTPEGRIYLRDLLLTRVVQSLSGLVPAE